jgi:hypothetical protein
VRKEQLDNLTKGTRPLLHASTPNWDTLKGLVEPRFRAIERQLRFPN